MHWNAIKTHCKHGHEFTLENTWIRTNGHRKCLKCDKLRHGNRVRRLADGVAAFNSLCSIYKRNAKNRNLEFCLTKEEIGSITKSNCHYCGVEPSNVFKSHNNTTGPYIYNGIDRADNEKGYVSSNCVPCCFGCNKAKGSMPVEQFQEWLDRIVKFRTTLKEAVEPAGKN